MFDKAKHEIIGRLGETPVLRQTKNGLPVTTFRVAVNESWMRQDGTQGKRTTWYTVVAWDRKAEALVRGAEVGCQISLELSGRNRRYEKADGTVVYSFEFHVDKFDWTESKADVARRKAQKASREQTPPVSPEAEMAYEEWYVRPDADGTGD